MNNYFKPASILFYLLMLLVFFFVGVYAVKLFGAADNQGLAGGAIVLVWGLLFSGVAFISSFFIVRAIAIKKIVKLNILLFVILIASIVITYLNYQARQVLKDNPEENQEQFERKPVEPTAMLLTKNNFENTIAKAESISENDMGLGFFTPNYYEFPVLYFYGNLNLEKALMEHSPYDSITFKINKYNTYEIATAPPWLVPDHLKLDYDMLYFRIVSISEDFVEVLVNTTNNQTSFVSRYAGKITYWPEFLLSVNSVEFNEKSDKKVRARHFEASSEVNIPYQFMRPIRIKGDWAHVLLLDDHLKKVGKGWIQWQECGQLLVTYNLLI